MWACTVELASVLTVATILADAAVTTPPLKLPKMCRVGRLILPHPYPALVSIILMYSFAVIISGFFK